MKQLYILFIYFGLQNIFAAPPTANPSTIDICDQGGDNIETVDLTSVEAQITSDINVTITYHLSLVDANSASNLIPDPVSYVAVGNVTIFVRVEDNTDNSFVTTTIDITLLDCPEPGQIDDFENGTTAEWKHKSGTSPNPPVNLSTDGPDGTDDNFLRNTSNGNPGSGGRMAVVNAPISTGGIPTQWAGNWNLAGIQEISFNVRNSGSSTLNVRFVISDEFISAGGGSGTVWVSDILATINGSSSWQAATVGLQESNFSRVVGTSSLQDVLDSVFEVRIISAASANWRGDRFVGTMDIDNFSGITNNLSIEDIGSAKINYVELYPNPAKNFITIKSDNDLQYVQVINSLGSVVMDKYTNNELNITNLKSGVYFLRIVFKNGTTVNRKIIKY